MSSITESQTDGHGATTPISNLSSLPYTIRLQLQAPIPAVSCMSICGHVLSRNDIQTRVPIRTVKSQASNHHLAFDEDEYLHVWKRHIDDNGRLAEFPDRSSFKLKMQHCAKGYIACWGIRRGEGRYRVGRVKALSSPSPDLARPSIDVAMPVFVRITYAAIMSWDVPQTAPKIRRAQISSPLTKQDRLQCRVITLLA
ncbi:hypothetical protein SODALDRAFT_362711 [Sodiomyces alkalinus F11]|uniref:Uncharacterized protein n=1 Tax=Sodiomyces alkalinus (strain CBS 110278 / VKM F-3762 / F11) TaxID=1314773 RepID=A0A3N2PMX3_SODAK|nr:hypothetical protein SODALDRAFT_362711 [Sodiomyces alkalinus F11]ROT35865.1 hypothetical protein SODALDRAFT_362711 [Sodiomyces alkalinus F11]